MYTEKCKNTATLLHNTHFQYSPALRYSRYGLWSLPSSLICAGSGRRSIWRPRVDAAFDVDTAAEADIVDDWIGVLVRKRIWALLSSNILFSSLLAFSAASLPLKSVMVACSVPLLLCPLVADRVLLLLLWLLWLVTVTVSTAVAMMVLRVVRALLRTFAGVVGSSSTVGLCENRWVIKTTHIWFSWMRMCTHTVGTFFAGPTPFSASLSERSTNGVFERDLLLSVISSMAANCNRNRTNYVWNQYRC